MIKAVLWAAICLLFITWLPARLAAADLYDLRVFPHPASGSISFSGTVSSADPWKKPTGKRARFSGMVSSWLASDTLRLETEGASCSSDVCDGEFSGHLSPASIASFSLQVFHDGNLLHQESFRFPERIELLVISDVDDTILVTQVTSRARMVVNSMFRSVESRQAVEGTPDLYRSISHGAVASGTPHFIYLSSSPAFLSRSLKAFMQQHDFPPGTLILKKSLTDGSHENHKLGWLKQIAGMYPGIPMLLFGDSGEKDPAIYTEFVESRIYPQEIRAVIIHDLCEETANSETLQQYANRLDRLQVPFIAWKEIAGLRQSLIRLGVLSTQTE